MFPRAHQVEQFWGAVRRAAAMLCLVAVVAGQWAVAPSLALPISASDSTLSASATVEKPFIGAPRLPRLGPAELRLSAPEGGRHWAVPPVVFPSADVTFASEVAGDAVQKSFADAVCLPVQRRPYDPCAPPVALS